MGEFLSDIWRSRYGKVYVVGFVLTLAWLVFGTDDPAWECRATVEQYLGAEDPDMGSCLYTFGEAALASLFWPLFVLVAAVGWIVGVSN